MEWVAIILVSWNRGTVPERLVARLIKERSLLNMFSDF